MRRFIFLYKEYNVKLVYTETAAREIKDFVDDCDGDTLAALYKYCFAAVASCEHDGGDYLYVELEAELEPKN